MANNMSDMNPIQVQKYLGGLKYPVDKQKLIDYAKNKGAPQEVIDTLNSIAGKTYNKPNDVTEEIGKSAM